MTRDTNHCKYFPTRIFSVQLMRSKYVHSPRAKIILRSLHCSKFAITYITSDRSTVFLYPDCFILPNRRSVAGLAMRLDPHIER